MTRPVRRVREARAMPGDLGYDVVLLCNAMVCRYSQYEPGGH